MNIYPYSYPLILTEAMYAEYGGVSGSATSAQLQNAFIIAEQRTTRYLGTFLLPTIVTGTYPYNRHQFVATDYGYVHQVLSANILSLDNLQTCTLQTDSGCTFIFEDTFGYVNVSCVYSVCGCATWKFPYQFQIAYQAGLPTGTANQPVFEQSLVISAEIALNEMLYPRANEGAGDIGIESWSGLDYSETRKKNPRTALGESPRANYAASLIKQYKVRRAIRMR